MNSTTATAEHKALADIRQAAGVRLGPRAALVALLGTLSFHYLARVPELVTLLMLLLASLVALYAWRHSRMIALALWLLCFAWTGLHAHWRLAERLQPQLDGQVQVLAGTVVGLPSVGEQSAFFEFRPDPQSQSLPSRIQVRWFRPGQPIKSGERYRLQLALSAPHGLHNVGSFDAERWVLERRLGARGTVRVGSINQRIGEIPSGLDGLRERVSSAIASNSGPGATLPLVQALAVGDQRALDTAHRERLQLTGTGHLIAISGLHIGLAAAVGGGLIWLLFAVLPGLGLHWPRPLVMAAGGLLVATGYAALAGFALPTQRALVMLSVIALACLLRRQISLAHGLALALLALLAFDPLAVLSGSFWLSFGAVALLLLLATRSGSRRGPLGLLRAQVVLSLGLAPLALLWFGMTSISGLLANLIAVPWVSLLVVPPTLLGVALETLHPGAGQLLFSLAAWLLLPLWTLLSWIGDLPMAALARPGLGVAALLFAILGLAIAVMPRGTPLRWLALPLLLPLLFPSQQGPAHGRVDVHVLDVGHGQAVLFRTRDHALLFDTGPGFAPAVATGDRVLGPAIAALGVEQLDGVIVSRAHAAVASGLTDIQSTFEPGWTRSSTPQQHAPAEHCLAGQQWNWNGVEFRLLHPPRFMPYSAHDSACTLQVRTAGASLLVSGGAAAIVESRLIREHGDELRADVLVSGRHGSRHANSMTFLQAVSPKYVIHSAGYLNRRNLPDADVLERIDSLGAMQLNTASAGAISFQLGSDGVSTPRSRRSDRPHYWHTARPLEPLSRHPLDR